MSLRLRLFIIISIGVLLVLGISLVLLLLARNNKDKAPAVITAPPSSTANTPIVADNGLPLPNLTVPQVGNGMVGKLPTTREAEQEGVKQLAKIFVERYNTYSSDNNFQNIREVKDLVTPELWKRISARLGTPASASRSFIGVTAEVISATMLNWKDTTVDVECKIRKTTEKLGSISSAYQTIKVTMVKSGAKWLVDKFETAK